MRAGVVLVEPSGRGGVWEYSCLLARALGSRTQVVLMTAGDFDAYFVRGEVSVITPFVWIRAEGGRAESRWVGMRRRTANAVRYVRTLFDGLRECPARSHPILHFQGCYWPPLVLLTVLTARIQRRVVIYTPHNAFARSSTALASTLWNWQQALIASLCSEVIVHTEHDRRVFPTLGALRRRLSVVPHGPTGVDESPAGKRESRAKLGLDPDAAWVLMFGNLRADKGVGDLLTALPAVVEKVPSARVLIAGDDRQQIGASAVSRLAQGLRSRVEFRPGYVESSEVSAYFSACDVVCLPYRQASDSGVAHRALTNGLRVVAYDVGGLREALGSSTSVFWVPANDTATLGARLAEVLETREQDVKPPLTPASSASMPSWDDIATDTLTVYAQHLARPDEL